MSFQNWYASFVWAMSAADVVADLENLLSRATRKTCRDLLEAEIAERRVPTHWPIKQHLEAATPKFVTISKYAWDQSKKFAKVYMTLPGIEKVPDDQVVCDVQATSLRFEVRGLPPPKANMQLVLTLHSPVEPEQCSWVRKADSMVLIKLRKADESEWGSLDDSAIQKARKKAQDMENNKGKSTAGARAHSSLQALTACACARLEPAR